MHSPGTILEILFIVNALSIAKLSLNGTHRCLATTAHISALTFPCVLKMAGLLLARGLNNTL